MQSKLVKLLTSYAPLYALCGNRIQWDMLPQGSPEGSIALWEVSGIVDYHMQGPSGLEVAHVQFDCRDSTAAQARIIANTLQAYLSGYSGTYEGYKIMLCKQVGRRTGSGMVDNKKWFTNSRDFEISWGLAS